MSIVKKRHSMESRDMTTLNGQVIGHRYDLQTVLGEGGMGAVYRAVDRLTGQTIALKRVTAPTENLEFASHAYGNDSIGLRLALAQEFRTLASLRHPHIINVLDYGFDDSGQPYFTMDLIQGANPLTEAAMDKPFERKIELLFQTLQAVAYLHRRGVIHRDLKPANVLVSDDLVKVLDFGLSMVHGQSATQEGEMAGTLAYIAPETLRGERAQAAADLYAIGVMAYEYLVGRHPFNTDNVGELIQNILFTMPDLSALEEIVPLSDKYADSVPTSPSDSPASFERIMEKLLTKFPYERYQDANQVIRDLALVLGQPVPEESAAVRESFLQAAHFVGREKELTLLEAALKSATQGKGGAWLIGGESGVGKSRLLDEMRILALVQGVIVLRGQVNPNGGLPFQLWREPLRRLLLHTEVSDLDAGVLKDIVPDIAQLQKRSIPDAAALETTSFQQRLFSTIASIFQRQTKPILLILEDLQWIGESLDVLRLLVGMVTDLPILIIATYRPEDRPGLPSELPDMTPMRLDRLSSEHVAALSESMLGSAGTQPHVIDLLQRETEGNVYFLIEVVRVLAEEAGRLENVGQQTLPQRVFAGGIETVIERRLARVPDDSQALLRLAAVAGREIDLKVMTEVKGNLSLDEWVTTCANCAVIEVQDGKWQFIHDKLRQVMLQNIPAHINRELHRVVAQALETVYPDSEEQAAILAQHWRAANDVAKELHYARRAGEYALHISTLSDALMYFERALNLLQAVALSDDERRQIRAELLLKLGETMEFTGDYARARIQLEEGLEMCRSLNDQAGAARALSLLGNIYWRQGNYAEATRCCEESLRQSEQIGEQLTTARALNRLGMVCFEQGDYQSAGQHFERSLEIAGALNDVEGRAGASNNLGLVAYSQGEYAQAAQHFEASLSICRASGQRRRVASALLNLGGVAGEQGDLETAHRYFEESLNLSRAIGERRAIGLALDNLGFLAVLRSEFANAANYFGQSLSIARAIGNRQGAAKTLINLGHVAKGQQDMREAMDYYCQALEAARDIDATPILLEGLVSLAEVLPDPERAATLLGLIIHHPATFQGIRQTAAPILEKLKTVLPPEQVEAALERGKTLDLKDAVQQELSNRPAPPQFITLT
jgi:predicted ATPase/tRNA A-37 threonylcarbamoyl transferase component Bud32